MNNLSDLLKVENQILTSTARIKKIENSNWLVRFLLINRLKRKLKDLEENQVYVVGEYLKENNNDFSKIALRNLKLLETNSIEFLVYDQDFPLFSSYTKKIEGTLHSNGFSYSNSIKYNFAFKPFDKRKYTSEMKGKMDYWGRINLITTKTKFALFKNVPKKFVGKIYADGTIHLFNVKNETDFFNNGRATIGKLIANHFLLNASGSEEFFNNKEILLKMIVDFRSELIETKV